MVRRVRTPEGMRFYDLPMGAPITASDIAAARARASDEGRAKGQKIAEAKGGGAAARKPGQRPVPRVRGDRPSASVPRRPGFAKERQQAVKDAQAQAAPPPVPEASSWAKFKEPEKPAKGKETISVGGMKFGVEPGSTTFSRQKSQVVYNLGEDGKKIRVFTPDGEVANLDQEQQEKIREFLDTEQDSFKVQEHAPAEPAEKPASEGGKSKPAADSGNKPESQPDGQRMDRGFATGGPAASEASGPSGENGVFNVGDTVDRTNANQLPEKSSVRAPSGATWYKIGDDEWMSASGAITTTDKLPSKPMEYGGEASDGELYEAQEMGHNRGDAAYEDEFGHEITELDLARPVRNPKSMGESTPPPNEAEIQDMQDSPYTSKWLNPDGSFTEERLKLHEQIIESFLEGLKPQENPIQYMNGGGPASGKGTMTVGENKKLTNYPASRKVDDLTGEFLPDEEPPNAVLIDPDAIKLQFPEVKEARDRISTAAQGGEAASDDDKGWAGKIHEESSQLAKRLHRAALERGYNVIYDGTGNGSAKSVLSKLNAAREMGYRVEANYLYLDPAEGFKRAQSRAERSNRVVLDHVIKGTYEKIPPIFQELIDMNAFDKVHLFDNNVERGQGAILIGRGDSQGFEVLDPERYDRFTKSGAQADKKPQEPQQEAIQKDLQTTRSSREANAGRN